MILVAAVLFAVAVLVSVALVNTLHVPADITTEQNARSLQTAERVAPQVRADLERLFLVHTSRADRNQLLPYAEEVGGPDPPLERVVANYSSATADVTVSDASRVVSVEYRNSSHGHSINGTLVQHNDSSHPFTYQGFDDGTNGEWDVMEDAESVSYLHLNVTGDGDITSGERFEVWVGGDNISFNDDAVLHDGTTILDGDNDDLYPVELELVDGVGEIRNATNRTAVELDDEAGEVTFHNGNETTGTFTITGTGENADSEMIGNEHDPYQFTREDVVVNPAFRVTYTDASLTYNSTFALYNRTEP